MDFEDNSDGDFVDDITFADFLPDNENENEKKESNLIKKRIKKPEVLEARFRTTDPKRQRFRKGEAIADPVPTTVISNNCFTLNNQPIDTQIYNGLTLAPHQPLQYDAFIPTGETYVFLPCPPFSDRAKEILGFKDDHGNSSIMKRYGNFMPVPGVFKPYKMLLYRGRSKTQPLLDDNHRFVYLAPSNPNESQVGDCFIRLEEIHKRMNGQSGDYEQDYELHVENAKILRDIAYAPTSDFKQDAENRLAALRNDRGGLLRFRCWTVTGVPSAEDEERLSRKLFWSMSGYQHDDCVELFRVWAGILRKSQGDKLAAKDFFGRYWDAVIPPDITGIFATGFLIIIGANYTQSQNYPTMDLLVDPQRDAMRKDVFEGVQRVVDTTRLKFRPVLSAANVFFADELTITCAQRWSDFGWRYLEEHPAGLYSIVVDLPVRQFLNGAIDGKPFWKPRYDAPPQLSAQLLDGRLTKCHAPSQPTTTEVNTLSVQGTKNRPRVPTQDKCVADRGYSANLAFSDIYPDYYPTPADAKKRRVAEWLHRSAFSYGGLIQGDPNSSQVPNNLVLGTPDTNTVMMRYEAFVKRLAFHANNQHGCTVVVETQIEYPALEGWNENWIGANQYTWLAPDLFYRYHNGDNQPRVFVDRHLYPFNRESSMLFQALLDKSLEHKCWNWNCWGNNDVGQTLIEAMRVGDDEEEGPSEEKTLELVNQDLAQRPL
ncbi:hypothetical protein FGLOB1_10000 [Fusarium globosum]|uniref:Uncharacterized protein n=1 Tax=Fusarium globosum TaxID=78864 RepID=A0A8H5XWV9_9HYPO|nr:hypothetical protein FGLOB1_10000 [Fusarium globosum]